MVEQRSSEVTPGLHGFGFGPEYLQPKKEAHSDLRYFHIPLKSLPTGRFVDDGKRFRKDIKKHQATFSQGIRHPVGPNLVVQTQKDQWKFHSFLDNSLGGRYSAVPIQQFPSRFNPENSQSDQEFLTQKER